MSTTASLDPLAGLMSRTRRIMSRWLVPAGVGAALVLLLALPLAVLAVGAFRTSSPLEPGSWRIPSPAVLWTIANRGDALTNSILLAIAVTVLSVSLAVTLGFLALRTDARLRKLVTPLMLVCAATSTLFYAIGYDLLANPFTGIVNKGAEQLLGVDGPLINVESWGGIIAVEALHATAFVYLLLLGAFRALDTAHEEAAAVAGAGRWRTMMTITLPLLAPSLTGVALIGLVAGLQIFDTALVLGDPAGISFFGVRIYHLLSQETPPRYSDASALSLGLVALIMVLCFVQARIVGRRSYVSVTGKAYRRTRWRLGPWRIACDLAIASFAIAAVVAPLAAILLTALAPYPGVYRDLGLDNFRAVLALPVFSQMVRTTLSLSVIAGGVSMLFALVIAATSRRVGRRTGALMRGSTLLPLAMPGIIAALAMIWVFATIPPLKPLYGTAWVMAAALLVLVLPMAVQIANGALGQIGPELADAARVGGAGPVRVFLTVTARLLMPTFLSGWFVAAILISSNLDVPLLLSSPSTQTTASATFSMYSQGAVGEAAALLTLLLGAIAVCGLLVGLSRLLTRRIRVLAPGGVA